MNRNIILLAGKAGSGKDTVANHLVKKYSFKRFAFADTLKEYVSKKYNIPLELLFTQEGKKQEIIVKKKKVTLRDLLIKDGAEKRQENQDYWVNMVIEKIQAESKTQNIVISDFRFPNEYRRLAETFFEIVAVKVVRENGCENIDDISETALNQFDFDRVLFNDRTIYDFEKLVDNDLPIIKQICQNRTKRLMKYQE
jgi:dephospho-CoA kinase